MINQTHIYKSITFFWTTKNGDGELTLRDRTYPEALEIAKEFGYQEPKWYKPRAWGNWLLTEW